MTGTINDEVRAFIRAHIHSVEQLEILLLLRRLPSRSLSSEEVARELRGHPVSAARWLEDLVGRHLVKRDGVRFQYAPNGVAYERDVSALANAYADYRAAVIQHIFSKPLG